MALAPGRVAERCAGLETPSRPLAAVSRRTHGALLAFWGLQRRMLRATALSEVDRGSDSGALLARPRPQEGVSGRVSKRRAAVASPRFVSAPNSVLRSERTSCCTLLRKKVTLSLTWFSNTTGSSFE